MKKFICIFLMLFLTGCGQPAITTTNNYEQQISEQQNEINELSETLVEISENQILLEQQLIQEITQLQNQVDELEQLLNEVPDYSYALDEGGNYITFEQLGNLLFDKYFTGYISQGSLSYNDDEILFTIVLTDLYLDDYEVNDLLARTCILINEFGDYSLYSQIKPMIRINLKVLNEMGTYESLSFIFNSELVNYISMTPEVIINNYYEIYFSSKYTQPNIFSSNYLYEQYLDTYEQYVLDFN